MAGPGSPGSEGPTFAPPHLPPGWIAQWDANSRKYYYVQLSTGVSQWDVPTDAAPIGATPASNVEHPYGVPVQPQLITHPDGTQTVKHPDGTMEPVMPDESGNTRAVGGDGPTGDRGLGTMAMNALLASKQSGQGHNSNSSPFGGLANQVISGLTHNNGGQGQQHNSSAGQGGSGGLGGKIVGQLASNLFSSGSKPSQPQNYHGGQTAQHTNTGGLAGAVMGGVANMFGGQPQNTNQNYGYTNSGQTGGYSGAAPPTSYHSSGHSSKPPQGSNTPSSYASASNPPQSTPQSYQAPASQAPHTPYGQAPQHQQSFPPPPNQYGGQFSYQGQPQPTQYGQQGQQGPSPVQPPSHTQFGQAPGPANFGITQPGGRLGQQQSPSYYAGQQGGVPMYNPSLGQYPPQPQYGSQGPPVPHEAHPYTNAPHF